MNPPRGIRWVVHELLASHAFRTTGEQHLVRVNDSSPVQVLDEYVCTCGLEVWRDPNHGPPEDNQRYTVFR